MKSIKQWDHPFQAFKIRWSISENIVSLEGMALEDDEIFQIIEEALEKVHSDLSGMDLNVHFYAVPYADTSVIEFFNALLHKKVPGVTLRCVWFYSSLSEKSFGDEWSGMMNLPFHLVDAEPEPICRNLIDHFNEKAANSGLYFRLVSNPTDATLIIEASQHVFFRYVDYTFYFEEVEFCNISDQMRWSDDYTLQWVFIEWEDTLNFCANHDLMLKEGQMLIRWLIHPIENQLGYILCKSFTVQSKWMG